MARINLDEVAHSYLPRPGEKDEDYALKRIHNIWDDGGAYALLGPSGCGKTTLLNIISGLLKPSRGRVKFDESDVTDLPPEKRNIAQVFQFPVLYDTMSVYNNLAFPLRNRGFDKSYIDKRVREVAEILDLEPVLKRKAEGLGADAKQKISLGRGLVRSDVAAILFDEPLTVIDPHLKWQLRCKLKEIHEQLKLTLIYVTHDQVEALTFADKIIVMYEGWIVQTGSPQELFEYPNHKFVGYFIGSPGMNFIPCTIRGNRAVVGDAQIPISEQAAEKGKNAEGKLELGIRPLYLKVHEQPAEHTFEVPVASVEDQGNYRIVTADFQGNLLKARISENDPVPESKAWLSFPEEWIRLFEDEHLMK